MASNENTATAASNRSGEHLPLTSEADDGSEFLSPLWLHDLTVAYHRKPVLWDVNLVVPEGKLIAVVGPNTK